MPRRDVMDHLFKPPPGQVWTNSMTDRQYATDPTTGVFTQLPPPPEPSTWEKFTGWVEHQVPGGWWTVTGAAGLAAYLLLVPPAPPRNKSGVRARPSDDKDKGAPKGRGA